ncbi:Dipeptidyl aminopeptidase/acylaminoacyl peptidase [Variovorax sp. OK605]|uniref:alpha/beta hydrolase family protein n=1 Tax=Variovorax sp. OK605 TaxID=1855317 RepID=UPI0008EB1107|nr:prolyl oligopeptidase family serine peptidase [Variovorax sp. OK605]SFO54375.1 Dipeptidyl aminopeptidase/acylaminoacyl peptidase [Variovorax sp. OK605]
MGTTQRPLRRRIAALALAGGSLALLGACGTAPTHPALVSAEQNNTLPPLVPMRRFVANVDAVNGHVLSPDGQQLVSVQTVGTDVGLGVRKTADAAEPGGAGTRTFTTGTLARPFVSGPTYTWLRNSRHIAYLKDFTGDENTQIFVLDTQLPDAKPWAVTPGAGIRSAYVGAGAPGSASFFFSNNRRDRSSMDLFEADALTRAVREVARSEPGSRVVGWFIDTQRELAGRMRQLGDDDGSDLVLELRQPDGSWRAFRTVQAFDSYWPQRIDRAAGKLWAFTNVGRDKLVLVETDLATGNEKVLAENAEVDLDYGVFPPQQGGPLAYVYEPDRPRIAYLDAALERDVRTAVKQARERGWLDAEPVIARPWSMSEDRQRLVVSAVTENEGTELLWDRGTQQVQRLTPPRPPTNALFSPMEPFSFKASDGLVVHGYLVRPRGVQGPAPLVVDIHGGPWVRDRWRAASYNGTQMLANRGYAVLNVNYRGSTGYGRAFMMAGANETNGRLQRDIAEAVQWAIDRGVADPQRMAVLGASFGGYSVLTQLIQKPHDYRCGVDLVGVANWPRVIENWPPFWRNRHYFAAFYGDVNKPEERARMLKNSPISQIDRITAPLLVIHGGNDVRVLRQDSDDVVAELRKLGRPVEFMTFPDEGHSVRKWRNRLAQSRKIEDALATCLGGRSNGFDFYELMPRQQ